MADLRGGDGGDRPPKGCKKRKKERKEVIFYCFCAVFEASSGDRPPPQKVSVGRGENSLNYPPLEPHRLPPLEIWPEENYTNYPPLEFTEHGTSSTTPPSKSGRKKTTPTTPPPRIHGTSSIDYPPSKSGRKTPPTTPPSNSRNLIDYPPLEIGRNGNSPPPEIQFLDPPLTLRQIFLDS